MEIKNLSIADLKSAYDFVIMDLKELHESAKMKNTPVETFPAYREVKSVEDKLWNELLNRTRHLK